MKITAYQIAERFIGMKEIPGSEHNPQILAMLNLDATWPEGDEVPWCSAFVNYVAWLLRLPRSKSLRARSWLNVGQAIDIIGKPAKRGFDVVILSRGKGEQPGPDVIDAPGHVGFYSGYEQGQGYADGTVHLLGGNQANSVSVKGYPANRVLGVRRLT